MTNSIQVANVFHHDARPDVTVVLTGGVRTPSDALVGPVAVATLHSLHVDLLFMGVHGLTEEAGFTTPNLLEAETNQALMASARRVVVVADHTKWGVRGLSRIADLSRADVVVSDGGLAPVARTTIAGFGVEILIASARRQGSRWPRRRRRAGPPSWRDAPA